MSQTHSRRLARCAKFAPRALAKSGVVLILLIALVCLPAVWAARPCGAAFKQDVAAVTCHECCAAAECCALEQQHETRPVEPPGLAGSASSFDTSFALSFAASAFLYALPPVEKTFVYTSVKSQAHAVAPLALSCVRLI